MNTGHRKGDRIIKITSFQTIKRGCWHLKISVTDMHSVMVLCQNVNEKDTPFAKFFSGEIEALAFIDFISAQSSYNV